MFKARHRRGTGIHLAGDTLYIVELNRGREGTALGALVQEALPGPFAPSQLASDELRLELAEFLRQVGRQYRVRYENPCLVLDHRMVLLKRRPLIQGDRKASLELMQWEAGQFLASGAEEYGMDFWWTRRHGFVVAARRRLLDLYLALCAEAGIAAPRFDLEPFALCNAAEAAGVLVAGSGELLLQLGSWGAHAVLLQDGELEAVGTCLWEEGQEGETSRAEVLADCVQGLLEEEGIQAPRRLWLAGAEAGASGWVRQVESRLSLAGQVLDPFAGVDRASLGGDGEAGVDRGAVFAVAVGLAYRGLGGE